VSTSDAANVTASCACVMLTCQLKVSIEHSLFPHTSANFRRLKKTLVQCLLELSVCIAAGDLKRNGR
jgi:hypothetical protein